MHSKFSVCLVLHTVFLSYFLLYALLIQKSCVGRFVQEMTPPFGGEGKLLWPLSSNHLPAFLPGIQVLDNQEK